MTHIQKHIPDGLFVSENLLLTVHVNTPPESTMLSLHIINLEYVHM